MLPLDGSSVRDLIVTGWSEFNSFDWSVDDKGFFIGNASGLASTLLFVDLNGKPHPLLQQNLSHLPGNNLSSTPRAAFAARAASFSRAIREQLLVGRRSLLGRASDDRSLCGSLHWGSAHHSF